jgi:hypothetical protein
MRFNVNELTLKLKALPPLLALSYLLLGLLGLVLLPLILPLACVAALIATLGLRRFSRHYLPPKAGRSYPKSRLPNLYKSKPHIEKTNLAEFNHQPEQ